jgi:hypothetical protein
VLGGFGLNNIGLLVRVFGKVTSIGQGYLYIDDGSNLRDGTGVEHIGVCVVCDPTGYKEGDYLSVTGISSCFTPGVVVKRILARSSGDIVKLNK